MADKNTILVVDDDPERFGFYWQVFNDDPEEFSPLPPQEGAARPHPLVPHSLGDFAQFEQMFRQMVERGDRHPLCIIDMRLAKQNDNRRGFDTVRLVRELDPDISIVVATHLPDIELEDVRQAAGENAFLFRLPMLDESLKADFRNTVHFLVDRWNAKQRMLRSMRESAPAAVPLSEMLNGICGEWQREQAPIEPYINPGLSVRSHREPLSQGLGCVLRHAVETSSPDGSIRVFGEGTPSGATVTVINEPRETAPRSLDEMKRAGAQALAFFLFEEFLRSAGGSLKVESGGSSAATTLTADIRHV
jgi:hypothetical protein